MSDITEQLENLINNLNALIGANAPWWLIAVWQMLLLFLEVKYCED